MYSIPRIEELIGIAEGTLSKYEAELVVNPKSLFAEGMIKNTNERLGELRANLAFEKRLREVEVVDLRMMGKLAKVGRLPLELLGSLSKILSDTIVEAGRQYQYGNKTGAKYQDLVKKSIDLKFDRLVPGSTRILVTGTTNPDLFGNSILENALSNTFSVLNVEDPQKLMESSDKIGIGGIKKLGDLLTISSKNELEFELEWKAPNDKTFKWEGKRDKIESLSNTLATIQITEPQSLEIQGVLIMQSLKGQIEIRGEDKKSVKIAFSNEMLENIKSLQIGDECTCRVFLHIVKNKITNEEKHNYSLISIVSI